MTIDMGMVRCIGRINIIRVSGREECNMVKENCARMEWSRKDNSKIMSLLLINKDPIAVGNSKMGAFYSITIRVII